MTKLILKLAVVFGGEGVMAWLFYRSRVVSHLSWADSDLVVFGVPLAVGFVVAAAIVFLSFPQMSPFKRIAATLGLSVVGAFISHFVGIAIAFNLYGT